MSRLSPLIIILLAAFLLRVHLLTDVPPGLTHDEANHGREAIGILGGNLALFFPLNYGSEPLYSYTVAALMALVGRGLLALRLVTVYFGLLAVSATYLWGRLALGRSTGWLAAALMSVSFWPLASSREALRAGMMPFFSAGAMIFFWLLVQQAWAPTSRAPTLRVQKTSLEPARDTPPAWILVAGLALCLTASLYNYLAARALWLVFPLFLLYLAFAERALLRRLWPAVAAALLISALSVTPMFVYLQRHPEAQTRLQMFGALEKLQQGNFGPLLQNASSALLAFVWPGFGDQFLAYNLPGRPVFIPLTAVFFVLGIAVCLWRWRRPRYAFLLIWFLVGVAPSLLTGATANTTRNVGAMPVAFLLPAVGFVALEQRLRASGNRPVVRRLTPLVAGIWLILLVWTTTGDYFVRWARAPEVRAAYQHTLVEQLAYVEANTEARRTVISSVLPGPAHNQSIGLVLLSEARLLRWVNAGWALILPQGNGGELLVPAATPLHRAFQAWVEPLETVSLRSDDLDPSFTAYRLGPVADLPERGDSATFGQTQPALTLLGGRWLTEQVRAGDTTELLQVWRVDEASAVGPLLPGINSTDVVLFTHILDEAGNIVAQQDRLDAPSASWQTGDIVIQVHRLQAPPQMASGIYTAVVGVYDRNSEQPLPVLGEQGRWDATRATVDPLNIIP